MAKISNSHYIKMKNSFRLDVAKYLADVALANGKVTYGDLSKKFGGNPRSWGDSLGGIAIRCSEAKYPILSVLVVNAVTQMPSIDAVLYEDLGMKSEADILAEMERCHRFDWKATPLARP